MIADLRIIDSPIGPVVPVNDIAEMMGYTRQGLSGLIRSHKDTLSPSTLSLSLHTAGGNQETQCITREGLDNLFLFMKTPKDPAKLPGFLEMRKSILSKFEGGNLQITANNHPALSGILTEYGRQARVLADEWGVDLPVAQKVVMATAIDKFPDLMPYRALVGPADIPDTPMLPAPASGPAADPDYERYISLRKLSHFCACSEPDARKILVDEGIIGYQNTHMVLTKYGHRFAKLFTVTPEAPHRMYEETRIRYSPDAVQLVRGKLASIQIALGQKRDLAPDQVMLSERAGKCP